MPFPAAADLLPGLLAWGLVALFVALTIVLFEGRRREHGVLRRLHHLIATPKRRVDLASPAGLLEPSEAAGLPRAAKAAASDQPAATPTAAAPTNPDTVARTPASESPRPPAPPALPGSRVASETLAPLADRVDRSRRLAASEAKVGLKLSELPRDRWVVDSYVMVGGHRIPYVVLGETGVFGIWPLDGAHHPQDPAYVNDDAKVLQNLLPGYAGEVQAGMCRAFDPKMQPRWWLAPPAKVGGWVMGLNWLIPWLEHFGTEHGLGTEDVARFDRLAGPHWAQRAKDVPLSRPPRSG